MRHAKTQTTVVHRVDWFDETHSRGVIPFVRPCFLRRFRHLNISRNIENSERKYIVMCSYLMIIKALVVVVEQ